MDKKTIVTSLLAAVGFLLTIMVGWAASTLSDLKVEAKEVSKSLAGLDKSVAVIVEKVSSHETRITNLEAK